MFPIQSCSLNPSIRLHTSLLWRVNIFSVLPSLPTKMQLIKHSLFVPNIQFRHRSVPPSVSKSTSKPSRPPGVPPPSRRKCAISPRASRGWTRAAACPGVNSTDIVPPSHACSLSYRLDRVIFTLRVSPLFIPQPSLAHPSPPQPHSFLPHPGQQVGGLNSCDKCAEQHASALEKAGCTRQAVEKICRLV